jgi:hypothetical protein
MRIRAFLIIAAVLAFPLQGTSTRTGTFGKTAIAAPRARSKGEERRATVKNAAMFYSTDQKSSVAIFIGKPIPRPVFEQGQVGI